MCHKCTRVSFILNRPPNENMIKCLPRVPHRDLLFLNNYYFKLADKIQNKLVLSTPSKTIE